MTWTNGMKLIDGSIYKGYLNRFGKRDGFGTFRNPIYIYGAIEPDKTSALIQWMEYRGEWCDDEPNGQGILKRYRGDGTSTVLYEGEWMSGLPASSAICDLSTPSKYTCEV